MVNDTDRGQLLLIAGLLVATTIIGSVVLLNSIHADASVGAQQDAQSLENADRAAGEITTDLDRLFMHTTAVDKTGEPLPYAEEDTLQETVETYHEEYRNLTANESASLVSVSLEDEEAGAIVRQNESEELPDGTLIEDAEELPRISINVTDPDNFELEFDGTGPAQTLEFEQDEVSFDGPSPNHDWTCDNLGNWFTVEFYNGVGEIRDDQGTVCSNKQLELPDSEFDVGFVDSPSDAEGNFTITATDDSASVGGAEGDVFINNDPGEGTQWGEDSTGVAEIIVNPVFELTYDDPSVRYSSTVKLYEEADYED